MKVRIIIAFILFSLCSARVVDWIFFSTRKENANLEMKDLNMKYVKDFPLFSNLSLKGLLWIQEICIVFSTISGLLFIKEKRKIFFALAILSFVLAFWQLFSLM